MSLSMIAARAENGAIGKDNRLLWHLSDDLKHFKRLTMGHPLIMGRKTFESLPGVLPGRAHYVLSRDTVYAVPQGVRIVPDVPSLLRILPEGENFVIGGASIYRLLFPYADILYMTEIEIPFVGDAFFPDFDPALWDVTETVPGESGTIPHRFVTYRRK